jgi:hypothetical protein
MFTKHARFHGVSHRHAAPSKAAYCNHNHPVLRLASRTPHRGLVCGWRHAPATGRLECFWNVPIDAAAAEEPGISRMSGQARRRRGARLGGKSPVRPAAA